MRDEAKKLLKRTLDLLNGPVGISSGVCMCGDDMEKHADAFMCGHSPVDSGVYYASQLKDDIESFLNKPENQPLMNVNQELDEDDPLWVTDSQIKDLLEGIGASEDHEDVLAFLRSTGLAENTVVRVHRAIVGAEQKRITFEQFRNANRTRCLKWHPAGIESWSDSDWMTATMGELGELAGLVKMRNRERDGLPGNKFSPTDEQIAKEAADVFTYLDLFCERNGIDLGTAAVEKFNEVSERVGFPDRIEI